jgi:SAM-dependent methyltransferase
MNSDFWNERYKASEYAYGLEPNQFLTTQSFKPNSNILCLAEGEGRNAVHLAKQGHRVTTIDYSIIGLQKTQLLAKNNGVLVDTICADLTTYNFTHEVWDVIICIFGHFPPSTRKLVHSQIFRSLRTGGKLVIEAYSKEQIVYKTGGPQNIELLYSIDELEEDFYEFETIQIDQIIRSVNEGKDHNGISSVIQVVAEK